MPEIEVRIAEGDSIDFAVGVIAELTDQADIGFAAGLDKAEGEDFVGRELVAGDDSRAVAAKNERVCFFGKDTAGSVRPEEKDGELF